MSYGFKNSSGEYTKIAGKGGSGGTTDYTELENKPSINNVELSGNKSADDLGLYTKEEIDGKLAVTNKTINDNWQGNGYNLLPFLYKDSSKTVNGITFTVNADGSITANGTATTSMWFNVIEHDDMPNLEIGKTYRLSGCPSGGGTATYFLKPRNAGGSEYDTGNGYIFTHSADIDDYLITIRFQSGVVCNNVVFKPMLVEVSDDGSYPTEYQRHALGNVELTQQVNNLVTVTDWNSLKEGFNAVYIPQNTVLGDFTAPNNMRGYIIKNGTNGNGCVTDYNDAHRYFILYSESFTLPYWRFEPVDIDTYSTTEHVVGRWIDKKPLYEITFDLGYLPNNTNKNVVDLTPYSIKYVVKYESFCYKVGDYGLQRPIPCTAINAANSIRIDVDTNNGSTPPYLRIVTGSDLSAYKGYATIRYTKTTD